MIRIAKVLLPTDLSEYAAGAVPYAVEFARSFGAALHLLSVVDAHWVGPVVNVEFPGQVEDTLQFHRQAAERGLRSLADELSGVAVRTEVLIGAPHVEIVRYARREEIDLIVLATHGRTGLAHALIGSVAEKVVQMAPCPVLTVKHSAHEFVMP